jgi:hypothetical protein
MFGYQQFKYNGSAFIVDNQVFSRYFRLMTVQHRILF